MEFNKRTMSDNSSIKANTAVHNRISCNYESLHKEIFNPEEQARIRQCVNLCLKTLRTSSKFKIALDYGCGSGNLTKHFLESGLRVAAVDVSIKFLKMVRNRFAERQDLILLNTSGGRLEYIKDKSIDLCACYSVLHHVPDYLALIKEFGRVTKTGGIIYLDHERCSSFWHKNDVYKNFLLLCSKKSGFSFARLRKYLKPHNYVNVIMRTFDKKYQPEGDIHVWEDDHIEWEEIESLLRKSGFEIVIKSDYLSYNNYPPEIYNKYKNECCDYTALIARKL